MYTGIDANINVKREINTFKVAYKLLQIALKSSLVHIPSTKHPCSPLGSGVMLK
jgi:hypothetical protein